MDTLQLLEMIGAVSHKAYPDEKGTESGVLQCNERAGQCLSHKAYPDEKGTERAPGEFDVLIGHGRHKAYPDEKGTER